MVLRYAKMLNGIDSLVVTKLDVFDAQPEIQVCTAYRYKGKPSRKCRRTWKRSQKFSPNTRRCLAGGKPTPGIREVKDLPTPRATT